MTGAAEFAELESSVVRAILVRRITLGPFSAVAAVLISNRIGYG
jgi:hypothetical protein